MGGFDDGLMLDVCLIRCRSNFSDLQIKTSKELKNPSYFYLEKTVKVTKAKVINSDR